MIAVQATIDSRDDRLRAVAQKVKVLAAASANGQRSEGSINGAEKDPAIILRFSPAATSDELREVREILAGSPGRRSVQFLFDRANGDSLRVEAGIEFRVDLTRDLEQKLSRWLITRKSDRPD